MIDVVVQTYNQNILFLTSTMSSSGSSSSSSSDSSSPAAFTPASPNGATPLAAAPSKAAKLVADGPVQCASKPSRRVLQLANTPWADVKPLSDDSDNEAVTAVPAVVPKSRVFVSVSSDDSDSESETPRAPVKQTYSKKCSGCGKGGHTRNSCPDKAICSNAGCKCVQCPIKAKLQAKQDLKKAKAINAELKKREKAKLDAYVAELIAKAERKAAKRAAKPPTSCRSDSDSDSDSASRKVKKAKVESM